MRTVFYTVVTGPGNGYVHDVRAMDHHGFDFVAIHDRYHQGFPGWESIQLDTQYPFDTEQFGHKQRWPKTQPDLFLADYEYSVYLDPKWELTDAFLRLCRERVELDLPWQAVAHPDRNNFYQEVVFAYGNGILSFEECIKLLNTLNSRNVNFHHFFTSLCTWIIRRHDADSQAIGRRWFELIQACYSNNVRDQLVFPFALDDSNQIHRVLNIDQLYQTGVKLNYPNQTRIKKTDWQARVHELIDVIERTTGIPRPPHL